ncbi:NAD(+)/NADH kinase [Fundidesulfovibrio butyratiphilus]
MPANVRNVLVVAKAGDERAMEAARELGGWIEELGVGCHVVQNRTRTDCRAGLRALLGDGPEPELVVVLGGDGTMISVARKLMGLCLPILGVNRGRLGFLSQLSWGPDCRERIVKAVTEGFAVNTVMMALCEVERQGEKVFSCGAVNDVVVSRGAIARLVRLGVSFAGERLGTFRADGMIVSTPTGTTAYSMSAGGPLVHPDLETFSLTPICAFLDTLKPMVLPTDRVLSLTVEEGAAGIMLTCDGQTLFPLETGDEVRITRAQKPMKLAAVGNHSYFGKLLDKGFITQR